MTNLEIIKTLKLENLSLFNESQKNISKQTVDTNNYLKLVEHLERCLERGGDLPDKILEDLAKTRFLLSKISEIQNSYHKKYSLFRDIGESIDVILRYSEFISDNSIILSLKEGKHFFIGKSYIYEVGEIIDKTKNTDNISEVDGIAKIVHAYIRLIKVVKNALNSLDVISPNDLHFYECIILKLNDLFQVTLQSKYHPLTNVQKSEKDKFKEVLLETIGTLYNIQSKIGSRKKFPLHEEQAFIESLITDEDNEEWTEEDELKYQRVMKRLER